jgi:hypothetical protein
MEVRMKEEGKKDVLVSIWIVIFTISLDAYFELICLWFTVSWRNSQGPSIILDKSTVEKIRYQSKLNQTCILLTARVKDEFLRLSSSTRLLKILIGLSDAKNLFANFSSLHTLVSLATKS